MTDNSQLRKRFRAIIGVTAAIVAIALGGSIPLMWNGGQHVLAVGFGLLLVVNITIAVASYEYVTNGET